MVRKFFQCWMFDTLTNIDKPWTSSRSPISLYESSRQNSTIFQNGVALRVYLVCFGMGENTKYQQLLIFFIRTDLCEKRHVDWKWKTKTTAASLFSCKPGLGVPIHVKMLFTLIGIAHYTILVLDRLPHINYIALAIGPFSLAIGTPRATLEESTWLWSSQMMVPAAMTLSSLNHLLAALISVIPC